MAIVSPYLSIISLNINGLNSLINRNRVAGWIKKKKRLYSAYKGLTSALRTHISSKCRDGERCFMQMETKREQG